MSRSPPPTSFNPARPVPPTAPAQRHRLHHVLLLLRLSCPFLTLLPPPTTTASLHTPHPENPKHEHKYQSRKISSQNVQLNYSVVMTEKWRAKSAEKTLKMRGVLVWNGWEWIKLWFKIFQYQHHENAAQPKLPTLAHPFSRSQTQCIHQPASAPSHHRLHQAPLQHGKFRDCLLPDKGKSSHRAICVSRCKDAKHPLRCRVGSLVSGLHQHEIQIFVIF